MNNKPYYKIQYYIDRSLSWLDVQRKYDSQEAAIDAADKSRRYRIMMICGKVRTPIDPALING